MVICSLKKLEENEYKRSTSIQEVHDKIGTKKKIIIRHKRKKEEMTEKIKNEPMKFPQQTQNHDMREKDIQEEEELGLKKE